MPPTAAQLSKAAKNKAAKKAAQVKAIAKQESLETTSTVRPGPSSTTQQLATSSRAHTISQEGEHNGHQKTGLIWCENHRCSKCRAAHARVTNTRKPKNLSDKHFLKAVDDFYKQACSCKCMLECAHKQDMEETLVKANMAIAPSQQATSTSNPVANCFQPSAETINANLKWGDTGCKSCDAHRCAACRKDLVQLAEKKLVGMSWPELIQATLALTERETRCGCTKGCHEHIFTPLSKTTPAVIAASSGSNAGASAATDTKSNGDVPRISAALAETYTGCNYCDTRKCVPCLSATISELLLDDTTLTPPQKEEARQEIRERITSCDCTKDCPDYPHAKLQNTQPELAKDTEASSEKGKQPTAKKVSKSTNAKTGKTATAKPRKSILKTNRQATSKESTGAKSVTIAESKPEIRGKTTFDIECAQCSAKRCIQCEKALLQSALKLTSVIEVEQEAYMVSPEEQEQLDTCLQCAHHLCRQYKMTSSDGHFDIRLRIPTEKELPSELGAWTAQWDADDQWKRVETAAQRLEANIANAVAFFKKEAADS